MRSFLLAVLVLMSGCAELGKTTSALEPPLMGHYCDAPVDGACLGCDIRCPYEQRASCKRGVTTRVAGNPQAVCTRGAVCECK